MFKAGKVVYTIAITYKLRMGEDTEKIVGEVENTPAIFGIFDYSVSSVIHNPYLHIETTLDNVKLDDCIEFSTLIKDYFDINRVVSIETRYIAKSDENQVMEKFYV